MSPLESFYKVIKLIPAEELIPATKHLIKIIITAPDLPRSRAALISAVNPHLTNVTYSLDKETGELIRKDKETT